MVSIFKEIKRDYASKMLLVKLTMTVKIDPRLVPERPDIAVASEDNIVVSDPVLCSGRSKKEISCLMMDRND